MTSGCILLLIPGLEGNSLLLEPVIAALPPQVKAINVEYPREGSMSYADLLPIVRAAVPVGHPCVVLGWSFGGPLAVLLAADPPPELQGVILVSTFIKGPQPWLRWLRPFLASPAAVLFGWLARIKARLGGYATPEIIRRQRQVYREMTPSAFAARMRTALTADVRPQFARVQLPMLYLAASHDVVVPAHCLRLIRAFSPNIAVETIAGPHLALATNPQEAVRRMMPFLERVIKKILSEE